MPSALGSTWYCQHVIMRSVLTLVSTIYLCPRAIWRLGPPGATKRDYILATGVEATIAAKGCIQNPHFTEASIQDGRILLAYSILRYRLFYSWTRTSPDPVIIHANHYAVTYWGTLCKFIIRVVGTCEVFALLHSVLSRSLIVLSMVPTPISPNQHRR